MRDCPHGARSDLVDNFPFMRPRRFAEETFIGLGFSAAALFLHSLFWRNAGPPWRDEIDTLVLAQTPWPQFFDRMEFSPFPAL